jgi:hypothetical protein
LLPPGGEVRVFLSHLEAHRLHDLIQSGDDRRVGDAQLFFYVFDLAAAADEDFDELELLARQAGQASEGEVALEGRATGRALESDDAQVVATHGAPSQDLMCGTGIASGSMRRIEAIEVTSHIEKIKGCLDFCQGSLDSIGQERLAPSALDALDLQRRALVSTR